MATARLTILEANGSIVPTSIEVTSDPLDDQACMDRVVQSAAVLWRIVTEDEEAET